MYTNNIELKKYNAFQTQALAKIFAQPKDVNELKKCYVDYPNEKKLIIGSGCNLFFTQNFDGLVIHPQILGIREISDISDESDIVFLEVKASEYWDSFVDLCVTKNYAGLENLSYIPSTVGAAPVQNIGAYGAEVKDCIHEVVALDTKTLEVISFSNSECNFGYRDSIFKQNIDRYIIISVVFMLKRSFVYKPKYSDLNQELENLESPNIQDVRNAVIKIRQRKLPDHNILPNCGSFFKNPYISKEVAASLKEEYPDLPLYPIENENYVKTSAAFLIDRAGYKGKREGQIGTYPKQPLIIVNYGSSDGNDIVAFKDEIQKAVAAKFSILLEPEVRIL